MKNLIKNLKIKRRAITVLAALHFFGNPSAKLKIVGVTGTSGKTTTATILYEIALALGYKVGLISTVEVLISGKEFVIERKNPTTPDALTLNKILQKMVEENCEYVFMEVTSHALDQGRVAGINFTGGIFTNLTQDHFDYHKNFENYFQAKKKFFKMLPGRAFALANVDDEYGRKMLERINARKFLYGFKSEPDSAQGFVEARDFYGEIKKIDIDGVQLIFNGQKIISKLLGKFNAYNLLAVWSACELLDFDMEKVNKILENVNAPSSRFEYFMSKGGIIGVVDYAHKPDALDNVISTARDIVREAGKGGRVISVFGCSGDKDPFKRPIMGKIGASLSDFSIFTSDNPRSEEPAKILEQMKPDLSPLELKKIKVIVDRDEAIIEGGKIAKKNDIVLLMGKGHETYQDIKGVKYPWSEMEKLKKALQ